MTVGSPVRLSTDDARRLLVRWHRLDRVVGQGTAALPDLLGALGCVQLDPLDRLGTNADLVVMARLDGLRRGDVYRALLPGRAFEHFAKERCLLPAASFPAWRETRGAAAWWRDEERLQRVDEGALADVLAEISERGPVRSDDLTPRGKVAPLDWSGWKGTSDANLMAIEVLWRRLAVVVTRREGNTKWYDVPARALPHVHDQPAPADLDAWMVLERARAAGLISATAGVWWSGLKHLRVPTVARLVAEGALVPVAIEGVKRTFYALPELFGPTDEPDDRLRILGPLDPLLWDRALVEAIFGFEYVWEVYKPAAQRRWGWYVVPLLHRGQLVGRLEAHTEAGRVVVDRVWRERPFDDDSLEAALAPYSTL